MVRRSSTKSRLKRAKGYRPKKALGQHFLRDRSVIHAIIDRAGFRSSDCVLEIGGGTGALTIPLAGFVRHLIVVEKDSQLTVLLRKKLTREGRENVTLINQDILKLNFAEILPDLPERIQVIGNLPYNISSPFLEKLITHRERVMRAVLMFQKEVARRLTATPGTKSYGALTVLLGYYARVSPLLAVPREAFYPKPKVDSMVVEVDFEKPYPGRSEDVSSFQRVVKGAFAYRRKTLLNALKGSFPVYEDEAISKALDMCRLDPGMRAEMLQIDDFLCLSAAMRSLS
ncbi:MAG: ribosomal RNA small subunit methyltransferase A [Deltaproteobacteria bacterium]|nr:ribosomal RNA small subunit methyltransferase A [Deltaproteobacteria bacterium]